MAAPTSGARHELPGTLVEVVGNRLRDAILSGVLAPGEKIREEQVCADYGISRAPLREALRLLAQQGLVEHLPRRGSRVAEWSASDILQLYGLRAVLERHAIETALPLADPKRALAPVRRAFDRMRAATDQLARDDAHRMFHAAVVGLAGNRQLDIALEPILLKLQVPMAMNMREEARRSTTRDGIARHRAILRALEANDADTVLAALDSHGHLDFNGALTQPTHD
ncbi:GntR family transcriptional regulator [Mycolicibacterium rutilum]|nr:GntR family transcriptional regulator [Mycolicibacterium rutilum]